MGTGQTAHLVWPVRVAYTSACCSTASGIASRLRCCRYGVLRPLDLIQPYRLEMGVRMAVAKCKSLCTWS